MENVETTEKPAIDQEKIDAAKKRVNDFTEEIKNKTYPVKIESEENLNAMKEFIELNAQWKNMEALGVIELHKQLQKQEIKSGNIFLKALEIDAINFFLSRVEGQGLQEAESHIALITAANGALSLVKADTNMMNQLLVELDAAEQGLEIEPIPTK